MLLGTAENNSKGYTATRKSKIRSQRVGIGWISRDHPVCFLALGQVQVKQENPLRFVSSMMTTFSVGKSPVSWQSTPWILPSLNESVVCCYNCED